MRHKWTKHPEERARCDRCGMKRERIPTGNYYYRSGSGCELAQQMSTRYTDLSGSEYWQTVVPPCIPDNKLVGSN